MKKMKKSLALLCALALVLSLCACGASSKGAASSAPQVSYNESYDTAAEAPAGAPEEPMPDAAWEAEMGYDGGLAAAGNAAASAPAGNTADVNPDKIIYSADVTLETTAFDDTVSAIAKLIEDYGGWIESSSVNDANYYSRARGYASSRSASYTLRVPSESFQKLMTGLSGLGNVPYTHTYTENVTAQYYDTQARLTAYRTQETRLLEMMEMAETVEDIIAIEEKLTELRYEIESLQSTLNNYDRRVNYSSVYLSVEEVQEYTPETVTELTYGQELARAFSRGFRNAGNFFKDLLVGLAGSVPTLLFLGALAVAAVVLVKKGRARRKAKKAGASPAEKKDES